MRRYFVSRKCLWCEQDLPIKEEVITLNHRSLVVSVCSPQCLEQLRTPLGRGKMRKRSMHRFVGDSVA
jgi:hypothetical protein